MEAISGTIKIIRESLENHNGCIKLLNEQCADNRTEIVSLKEELKSLTATGKLAASKEAVIISNAIESIAEALGEVARQLDRIATNT